MTNKADVIIEDHGTIVVFELNTDAARDFVNENVKIEDWQWVGPLGLRKFVADHRVANDLIAVLRADGLGVWTR